MAKTSKSAQVKQYGPGDDREFMLKPDLWWRWPFLPVKRHVGYDIECGLLLAHEKFRWTVHILNLWHLPDSGTLMELHDSCEKKHEYSSVDELLKDGWVVD